MKRREVVLTGLGVVSPVASELNQFWDDIKKGKSGIKAVANVPDIENYAVRIGGEIRDLDLEKFFDKKVYLNIWVKVMSGWSSGEAALGRLGYGD